MIAVNKYVFFVVTMTITNGGTRIWGFGHVIRNNIKEDMWRMYDN